MPLNTQARLLRVLEYGELIKVGSSKVQKTDVRVVAATNSNLRQAVDENKFREDLYYRLNTVPIFVPPLRERGEDILLLFRKFASDFAEKYRTKPLFLTEEAKNILLKYRFPGNIRQLKNLVEQISILESNKEITSEIILKYLPQESSFMPALYHTRREEGISERDLLYKILFEMRRDVTELKKLVHNILKEERVDRQVLKDHENLFENLEHEEIPKEIEEPKTYILNPDRYKKGDYDYVNVEEITQDAEEEESLSLEDKEKELIMKALRKNNNKRKYAARDLGISERTLYRKIKQYEIEE
jgi:transcriptional regulator with GAF, ATPase, and Fis domain